MNRPSRNREKVFSQPRRLTSWDIAKNWKHGFAIGTCYFLMHLPFRGTTSASIHLLSSNLFVGKHVPQMSPSICRFLQEYLSFTLRDQEHKSAKGWKFWWILGTFGQGPWIPSITCWISIGRIKVVTVTHTCMTETELIPLRLSQHLRSSTTYKTLVWMEWIRFDDAVCKSYGRKMQNIWTSIRRAFFLVVFPFLCM